MSSTDEVPAGGNAAIDAALQGLRNTLAADGYELAWSLDEGEEVAIRVVAGSDTCADCLVPAEVMRSIVEDALARTRYRVGRIALPAKS